MIHLLEGVVAPSKPPLETSSLLTAPVEGCLESTRCGLSLHKLTAKVLNLRISVAQRSRERTLLLLKLLLLIVYSRAFCTSGFHRLTQRGERDVHPIVQGPLDLKRGQSARSLWMVSISACQGALLGNSLLYTPPEAPCINV